MHPAIPNTAHQHTTAPFRTKAGFAVMISPPTLSPQWSQGPRHTAEIQQGDD
jgi:hypothetical protein